MQIPIPDAAAFAERLAGLSLVKCQTGETVLTAGSSTGRLLVLGSDAVEVVKDGVQIAKVSAPGVGVRRAGRSPGSAPYGGR